ncbi:hypothetical protein L1887_32419 [Cichorium endivia]|nr:hypothetical protein L1887_32419 [Cichorium endivia]
MKACRLWKSEDYLNLKVASTDARDFVPYSDPASNEMTIWAHHLAERYASFLKAYGMRATYFLSIMHHLCVFGQREEHQQRKEESGGALATMISTMIEMMTIKGDPFEFDLSLHSIIKSSIIN